MDKKRMAGNYEIINAIHIGDKEIVLGVDMNNADGHYYYVADCERNDIFELFTNAVVGDNFLEIAEIYTDRLKEQIETVRAENKGYPDKIITADMCESKDDKDLEGEIIVIRADVLRPEYRAEAHQIVRCTGGFGSHPNSRGNAVFCDKLISGKHTRFERYDVLGILKKEHYPKWLTERLEFEKAAMQNPHLFEYEGFHFIPVGMFLPHSFKDYKFDKDLCMRTYGNSKVAYSPKSFYKTCGNIAVDVFRCVENGKIYVPTESELFEYVGKYKEVTEADLRKKTKKHKDKER